MKLVSLFLTGLLALVAAGRFHAEAHVRQSERALSQLATQKEQVLQDIEQARLDVEVLESAGRLSDLNANHTHLRTVKATQLVDHVDLANVIGLSAPEKPSLVPVNADVIGNALSMIDPSLAEKAVQE